MTHLLESILQGAVIFLALSAMYLLNCAKTAQTRGVGSRIVPQGKKFMERLNYILSDRDFTEKWGKITFVLAIVALLLNLSISYLAHPHR